MTKPAILFLCVHNAGRSQMAAAFARSIGGDALTVYSAGTQPGEMLHPVVVEVMAEVGLDITDQKPMALTEEMARASRVVVTMGCGDECPYYPGVKYLDWPLDDPKGQPLEKVRAIRDDIRDRVAALVDSVLAE